MVIYIWHFFNLKISTSGILLMLFILKVVSLLLVHRTEYGIKQELIKQTVIPGLNKKKEKMHKTWDRKEMLMHEQKLSILEHSQDRKWKSCWSRQPSCSGGKHSTLTDQTTLLCYGATEKSHSCQCSKNSVNKNGSKLRLSAACSYHWFVVAYHWITSFLPFIAKMHFISWVKKKSQTLLA